MAADFASTRPAARVEYWQQRQATIDAQVADAAGLQAAKLVLVGDSITDSARDSAVVRPVNARLAALVRSAETGSRVTGQ